MTYSTVVTCSEQFLSPACIHSEIAKIIHVVEKIGECHQRPCVLGQSLGLPLDGVILHVQSMLSCSDTLVEASIQFAPHVWTVVARRDFPCFVDIFELKPVSDIADDSFKVRTGSRFLRALPKAAGHRLDVSVNTMAYLASLLEFHEWSLIRPQLSILLFVIVYILSRCSLPYEKRF